MHLACDFRLTDARTQRLIEDSAHKLVRVGTERSALVGVTGLAHLDSIPVGEWIVRRLGTLEPGPDFLDRIVESLRSSAQSSAAYIRDALVRRTTFVVGGFSGTQARIVLVSNFEAFFNGRVKREGLAADRFAVSGIRPKAPIYFTTGVTGVEKPEDIEKARLLVRSEADDSAIQRSLAEINKWVSARSLSVSPGCYTATIHATGSGSSQPFLSGGQLDSPFIPPDVQLMMHELQTVFRPAIKPDGHPSPIQIRGTTHAFIGTGEKYWQGQLRLTPHSAAVWNNYGADLAGRGRFEEARRAYTRACELDETYPTPRVNLAGRVWVDLGDAATAEGLFQEAFAIWKNKIPSNEIVRYANFRLYAYRDEAEAEALFRKACRDKDCPMAPVRLAQLLLETGRGKDEAVDLLASARERFPTNQEVLGHVGFAEFRYLGLPEQGRARLEQACVADPTNADLLTMAGDVCLLTGDPSTASYYYRKAIKRLPTHWAIHLNWGLALALEQNFEAALKHLREATAIVPPDQSASVQINLAAVLWASGDRSAAVDLLHSLQGHLPLPREVEMELLAMLEIAGEGSHRDRIADLVASGPLPTALTMQAMALGGTATEQTVARELAALLVNDSL
ncbi:hypothetical protein GCM10022242_19750 [Nocardioides panacisoli]|uniref:Tetratricopeptide repeat protein n=1 Tax=Nocardioides panacisoli TaxID=627624 RepID=A0ABP7IGF0_9ACTN